VVRDVLSGSSVAIRADATVPQVLDVQEGSDEESARRRVDREELVAVLIVPQGFSEGLVSGSATLRAYTNDRYVFRGVLVSGLTELLAQSISSAAITVRTTINGLMGDLSARLDLQDGALTDDLLDLALLAASTESNPVQVQRGEPLARLPSVDLPRYVAASVAIMFTGFWGLLTSASLFREKAQGTLQRTYLTPTAPATILAGKTLGTYLGGLAQMGLLVVGIGAMEWASGAAPERLSFDFLGLLLLVLGMLAATTGIGVLVAALAGSYVRAANYGRAAVVLLGLVGGAFIPVEMFPLPVQHLARLTYPFWAMDGYLRLALGGDVRSIVPHALVLGGMGVLFLALGGWLLRRRLDAF
jgi:ABC-2 type transport system permease protein